MHKRFLLAASALAVLAGCGGGGGSSIAGGGGGPAPAPEAAPVGSAKFTVDARTGEVKVEPISASRAAFSGGALSFTSSLLLSEGSPERRVLRVTAKNNTKETIGASGSFRVLFTNFQNANTPLTDLRSLVQTTTIWGNGTATTTFGGQTTATINAPRALSYFPATETLYATNSTGEVFSAQAGTVSRPLNITALGGVAAGPGFRLLARTTDMRIQLDGEVATNLAGSTAGNVDGTFSASRFTDFNDVFIIRATGPNDFEAVIADGTRVRLMRRTPSFPNGDVSTLADIGDEVRGVTFKNGHYYATANHSVHVIRPSGLQLSSIGILSAGYVDGGGSAARFNTPSGLRWVGNSLFVADTGNHRIRQINLRPGGDPMSVPSWWVSTVSGNGTASGVDGTGSFITHNGPLGLSQGESEELFVADHGGHRIRRIKPISNRFLDNFGDSTANPTELAQLINATDYVPSSPTRTPLILEDQSIPAGGEVTLGDWQFNLPEGLKSFSFVVTVEADTLVAGVLPSVSNTGSGTKGSPFVSLRTLTGSIGPGSADGSLAGAAFRSVQGICVTDAGDLFVADFHNNSIRRISKAGVVNTILGPSPTGFTIDGVWPTSSAQVPTAIACSPDGTKVYFSQSNFLVRVLELVGGNPASPQDWKVTSIAGAVGEIGNTMDTTGDLARLSAVVGMAVINENTIVCTDSSNNCVFTIERRGPGNSSANYYVQRIAGSTSAVSGYVDGTGSAARFNDPKGIAYGKNGLLYVADSGNRRIRRLDLGGVTTTLAGSGASGTLDSNNPLGATFVTPFGIAVEPSGYVYVVDLTSRQVRRVSPSGAVTTVAGTAGTTGYQDGTGNTGTFALPLYLQVGPGGDVYVGDASRIRLLQRIITN